MSTVYLHFGLPKTGTSAIQKTLFDYHDFLLNYSVLYPKTGIMDNAHYGISTSFADSIKRHPKISATPNEILGSLKQEIDLFNTKTVVISSEYFAIVNNYEKIREFFNKFDIKIILYLRRHDHWYQSNYCQVFKNLDNPKWGFGIRNYIEYVNNNPRLTYMKYRFFIDKLADIFGNENIIVRVYEKEQCEHGVIPDFLKILNLPDDTMVYQEKSLIINKSLDSKTVYLLDILSRLEIKHDNKVLIKKHLIHQASEDSELVDFIGKKFRMEIIERNMKDYEYIAKKFLKRKNGVLFKEILPSENSKLVQFSNPDIIDTINRLIDYKYSRNNNCNLNINSGKLSAKKNILKLGFKKIFSCKLGIFVKMKQFIKIQIKKYL